MATFKETLTFGDALRLTGPAAFNVMLKPAGSLCNLDCHYCYYLDKAEIYGGREPKMSEEMLETCIREYIQANDVKDVTFNWHGGEPLVMGLDFYRRAMGLQRKYGGDKRIHNTLQTNGTLLTKEWAEFFRDNNFLIGISIDGPQDIHDKYRRDKGGQPTFASVMRGVELLYRNNVQYNTMTTVNKVSEGRGLDVYKFLKSIGSHYMQFMAVLEHVKYPVDANGKPLKTARPYIVDPYGKDAELARWSVSALGFGTFLCDIFDYWVRNDVGQYFVNQFDAALACWYGEMPGTCVYAETCGGNTVIEHNGDVYPCDHFVYPKYLLGNITQTSLRELITSQGQVKFGIDKRNGLPSKCLKCRYRFACNGECPKHRFGDAGSETNSPKLNALCDGYYKFYSHIEPYMNKMVELLKSEQPPAAVIPWARQRK